MDSFKAFNDRFGHLAGDERLREMAALLRSGIRSPDIVARYGGEEFALILPNTTKDSAIILAERLRAAAEQRAPESSENKAAIAGYTISIGVAAYPEDGLTVYELLYATDQAEMTAKKLGKNCVYPAA
jgi:diguanylate cyclase (GGDEF)-like protein